MSSLAEVFELLNEMRTEGVVADYALGGAMAVLFYAEPIRTFDVDVFVMVPASEGLVSLSPIYSWLRERGFHPEAEHVLIHGVPVQFLPAYNALVEDAIRAARVLDYEDAEVRVSPPEHLIALALQTGGRKRRERAFHLLESVEVDRERVQRLLETHGILAGDLFDD